MSAADRRQPTDPAPRDGAIRFTRRPGRNPGSGASARADRPARRHLRARGPHLGLPAAPVTAPTTDTVVLSAGCPMDRSPRVRVLFVCTANICRSPYAQLRAAALAPELAVASAGLEGFDAADMDAEMAGQLHLRGIDATGFASRPIAAEDVHAADLVATFEARQLKQLAKRYPEAAAKTFTLAQLAAAARIPQVATGAAFVGHARATSGKPRRKEDIADPYRRGTSAAALCAVQIDRTLHATLSAVTGRALPPLL